MPGFCWEVNSRASMVQARADSQFGLEQHAASEVGAVARFRIDAQRGRIVEHQTDARAQVDPADFRLPADAHADEVRIACGVYRREDIGLRPAQCAKRLDLFEAVARLDIHAAFARVESKGRIDAVGIGAAVDFARGCTGGKQRGSQGQG